MLKLFGLHLHEDANTMFKGCFFSTPPEGFGILDCVLKLDPNGNIYGSKGHNWWLCTGTLKRCLDVTTPMMDTIGGFSQKWNGRESVVPEINHDSGSHSGKELSLAGGFANHPNIKMDMGFQQYQKWTNRASALLKTESKLENFKSVHIQIPTKKDFVWRLERGVLFILTV